MLKTVTTTVETKVGLPAKDLIALLVKEELIPEGAKLKGVYFQVPRGGDYSGCRLDLEEEEPLEIHYTQTTSKVCP